MFVNVGNSDAIEGFRDPQSDDPDLVRYRSLEGERVTEIVFPDDFTVNEAFSTTLAALEHHLASGATPAWVDSDSEGLTVLLQEHWGLTKAKTKRPKSWGEKTGADAFVANAGREG